MSSEWVNEQGSRSETEGAGGEDGGEGDDGQCVEGVDWTGLRRVYHDHYINRVYFTLAGVNVHNATTAGQGTVSGLQTRAYSSVCCACTLC